MIPEKIKYTSQFEYRGISEWISIEGSIEENETFADALIKAKSIVIDAYKSASPEKFASGESIIQKDVDATLDQQILSELNKCYEEISSSDNEQKAFEVAKKYGFSLRPEIKAFIQKTFSNIN